ncbi:MAG: hypothetical protein IPH89_06600 [Bacteroidetes bacterium]|nr:hypothetical protein [Bacteroidota bacterium]
MIVKFSYKIDTSAYPNIIKIVFRDEHDFSLLDAKELLEDLKIICHEKPFPILKIPGQYSSIDNDARKFISSTEGMKCSSAEALVTTYLPHRIIGNFYMTVNKPVKPTAFFEDEEKAINWLKQFNK